MILRGRVLGEPANHAPSPLLLTPTFIRSKNYEKLFAFQEHQKCIFKVSGEAKMQNSPLVPTMVAPTINTYVENKFWLLLFKKHTRVSDIDKVKFVCSASDSFLL